MGRSSDDDDDDDEDDDDEKEEEQEQEQKQGDDGQSEEEEDDGRVPVKDLDRSQVFACDEDGHEEFFCPKHPLCFREEHSREARSKTKGKDEKRAKAAQVDATAEPALKKMLADLPKPQVALFVGKSDEAPGLLVPGLQVRGQSVPLPMDELRTAPAETLAGADWDFKNPGNEDALKELASRAMRTLHLSPAGRVPCALEKRLLVAQTPTSGLFLLPALEKPTQERPAVATLWVQLPSSSPSSVLTVVGVGGDESELFGGSAYESEWAIHPSCFVATLQPPASGTRVVVVFTIRCPPAYCGRLTPEPAPPPIDSDALRAAFTAWTAASEMDEDGDATSPCIVMPLAVDYGADATPDALRPADRVRYEAIARAAGPDVALSLVSVRMEATHHDESGESYYLGTTVPALDAEISVSRRWLARLDNHLDSRCTIVKDNSFQEGYKMRDTAYEISATFSALIVVHFPRAVELLMTKFTGWMKPDKLRGILEQPLVARHVRSHATRRFAQRVIGSIKCPSYYAEDDAAVVEILAEAHEAAPAQVWEAALGEGDGYGYGYGGRQPTGPRALRSYIKADFWDKLQPPEHAQALLRVAAMDPLPKRGSPECDAFVRVLARLPCSVFAEKLAAALDDSALADWVKAITSVDAPLSKEHCVAGVQAVVARLFPRKGDGAEPANDFQDAAKIAILASSWPGSPTFLESVAFVDELRDAAQGDKEKQRALELRILRHWLERDPKPGLNSAAMRGLVDGFVAREAADADAGVVRVLDSDDLFPDVEPPPKLTYDALEAPQWLNEFIASPAGVVELVVDAQRAQEAKLVLQSAGPYFDASGASPALERTSARDGSVKLAKKVSGAAPLREATEAFLKKLREVAWEV